MESFSLAFDEQFDDFDACNGNNHLFTPIELDHERIPSSVDGLPWADSTLIGADLPAESNEDSMLYSPPPATTEDLVADLAFADVNPAAQLSATDDPAVSALAHLWLRQRRCL